MKNALLLVSCLSSAFACAMPLGLRTAVWGGSAAVRLSDLEAAFPALGSEATKEDVSEVLSGAADSALAENITDVDEYAEFREWAKYANAAEVKDSVTAWLSFAIGAKGIIEEPKEGSLSIDAVCIKEDGSLEVVFSLDGVNVGNEVVERRLKTVFGVEDATTLSKSAFAVNESDVKLSSNGDGRISAVVAPPKEKDTYFVRIKIK